MVQSKTYYMPVWRRMRAEFYFQLPIEVQEFLDLCNDHPVSTTAVAFMVKLIMKENHFSQPEKANVERLYKFLGECGIADAPNPTHSLLPGTVIRRLTPQSKTQLKLLPSRMQLWMISCGCGDVDSIKIILQRESAASEMV